MGLEEMQNCKIMYKGKILNDKKKELKEIFKSSSSSESNVNEVHVVPKDETEKVYS